MANEAKIGVVTVTYNAEAFLDAFFRDTLRQSHANFVLYVVDNASSDTSVEKSRLVKDERIQIIEVGKNLGVAEGNNIGIRMAIDDGCTHLLLINNDTEFSEDLFATLLGEMNRLRADMVVPKMYFFEPNDLIWCAGARFSKRFGWSTPHTGEGEVDRGQFDEVRKIDYCPTCCMLISLDAFQEIGFMDPKYFVYFDDTDFCLRAMRKGKDLYYVPTAKLWHKISSSTGGTDSPFHIKMYSRNKVYFLLKNFGAYSMPWVAAYLIYLFVLPLVSRRKWNFGARLSSFYSGVRLALGN